ncbi:MAG: DUF2231 domain-containing protein [Nocardioides sp.]
MEISGLPLHPLIVHAVVVFAPLAALLATAYAVRPAWRWLLRWPLVAATVISASTGLVAARSGEDLLGTLPGLRESVPMNTHEERGELLRLVLLVFLVVVALACWRLGGASALASGRGARTLHGGGIDLALAALLVVAAVAVMVTTILAGHTGAVVVWS